MNFKRIGRSLMCLLLVCCLLFNAFPQKADATGVGAAVITGAASVAVPALNVVGATLIALGLYVGVNGTDGIEAVAQSAVSHLESVGTYIKDGCVELLQTVNSAGEKAYYVAGEMMDDLRSWVYSEENESPIIYANPAVKFLPSLASGIRFNGDYYSGSNLRTLSYYTCGFDDDDTFSFSFFNYVFNFKSGEVIRFGESISNLNYESRRYISRSDCIYYYVFSSVGTRYNLSELDEVRSRYNSLGYFDATSISDPKGYIINSYLSNPSEFITDHDLTLGSLPSQTMSFTDGTVADDAFKDYLGKRIRFRKTDNPQEPDGDENTYSWLIPLSLATAGTIWAKTQADQWTGKTDSDYEDYTVVENLTITATPTIGGYPGILTTPNLGSGSKDDDIPAVPPAIGGGSTTITPSDGLSGTLSETGAQTFLESIGSFFGTWFDSILQWLKTLWELIQAGIISLVEALAALPAAIADAISVVLTKAFAISDTFIQTKVEALKAKYPYLDTFLGLGTNLKGFFMNLGAKPPIIYIDLGSATGSYLFGGKTVFVDLTWYSQYKSLMDSIIGAFIWLWLAWRVFLSIPGIIQGEAGTWGQKQNDIGMGTTAPPIIFTQKTLPSGRHSRGNKE